jgi:CHAT domain-containing protein
MLFPFPLRSGAFPRHLARTAIFLFVLAASFLALAKLLIGEKTKAETAAPTEIVSGSVHDGEISPGNSGEVFDIKVEQGKILQVSIDKDDLLLTAELYAPGGTKLSGQVSQEFEAVQLCYPAVQAGTYRIEIRSGESNPSPAKYHLRADSQTTITTSSRRDCEARQAMANAGSLRTEWTESSLHRSIEQFDKAAAIWSAERVYSNASHALRQSGDVYFLQSDYAEALKRYNDSESLAEKASDRFAEAITRSHRGLLYSYLGNNDLAQEEITKALSILEPLQANSRWSRNVFGEALCNLAEVTYSRGDLLKARGQFVGALKVLQSNRQIEAHIHLFIGYISGGSGDPKNAGSEIATALEMFRAIKNRRGEGLGLTASGLFHSLTRDEDRATSLHQEAIEIFRTIGDRHSEAIATTALGQSSENISQYELALSYYKKALEIFQNRGAQDLTPVAMCKVASTYRLMRDFDQSLKYYDRCLSLSRSVKKLRTEANALNEVATIYALQGRTVLAVQQYERIRKFYEAIGDLQGQAASLNTHGDYLLQIGQKENAVEAYSKALSLIRRAGDNGILISTLYSLAHAHRELGHFAEALSLIDQSLNIIETLRSNVGSPDFRATYFSGVRKHYELCIAVLRKLDEQQPGKGYGERALLVSEKARARSLIDLLTESRADLRQEASPALLARERELEEALTLLSQYEMDLSWRKADAHEAADVAERKLQTRAEYQEVQAKLRDRNSHAISLARFVPLDLKQIQAQLPEGTMLLEYFLGDERSYLWTVTSNSFQAYELPARSVIEPMASDLYKAVIARQGFNGGNDSEYQKNIETSDKVYAEKARSLSELLLGQVADQLGTKRLVIVTEGSLQVIPFDALPEPGVNRSDARLVTAHEIVLEPSISTLIAIRSEKSRSPVTSRTVAVLADPVFGVGDERVQNQSTSPIVVASAINSSPLRGPDGSAGPARLSHASEEADAILASAPLGTTLIAKGFDASREMAMSPEVSQYQIVHFATHGFLDSEHPELSGIVLTMVDRNGGKKNGLMPLHDIYNLNLSAELAVLSACQTALGKDVSGEGLVGLTHSFMSAGSKSVVASLWKVDDRATAVLMGEFYDAMLKRGMTPAAALRSAKLKMMRDPNWDAPYYWAGFVLQGEYTHRIAVEGNSRSGMGIVIALVLILSPLSLILFRLLRRRSVTSQQ